jgi:hypothetical protein
MHLPALCLVRTISVVRAGQRQNVSRHGTAAAVASFFFLKFDVIPYESSHPCCPLSPLQMSHCTSAAPAHSPSLTSLSHTHFQRRMYLSFTEDSQIFTYLSTRSRKVEIAPEQCTAHGQAHWDPRVSTFLLACLVGAEHRVHFCQARPRDESRQLR